MNLDWDLVDKALNSQINLRQGFVEGYYDIKSITKYRTSFDLFENVDEGRMQAEFNDWVIDIFSNQNIPQKIKSIYFGLFTMTDPSFNSGKETTTIHVCGSILTLNEDNDWACDAEFMPDNRYIVLTDFIILDKNIKSKVRSDRALETLVFNGLLNLLLINLLNTAKNLLLKNHKKLIIGAGYDEGEPYIIDNF